MSNLEKYQAFVRKNGKEITGIDVPVVLSDEENKQSDLKFTFGWTISIGVSHHDHGAYRPSGSGTVFCGRGSEASNQAHSDAKKYISGQDPLFNDRMKKCLCTNVTKNFVLADQNLHSSAEQYVGQDPCHNCGGSGSNSCYSCNGRGDKSCSSCSGSGRKQVQKYDHQNERTVYSTESCNGCYGSGKTRCGTCSGTGSITCNTCNGGGYLYCSYTIDGNAERSTKWLFENTDYHAWSDNFVKNQALQIVYSMNDIQEVDAGDTFGGCTFFYAMKAVLPTLQFKADVKGGSTHLQFAGRNNLTHDAGGVYDPAVWSIGQKLGSGDKEIDIEVLAVPAIKSIVEASETKTSLDLVSQNWVSSDIRDAVVTNYHELVAQLKKASNKGIVSKMFTGLFKNAYLLVMFAAFVALLLPGFANDVNERFNLWNYSNLIEAYFNGYYRLFGVHQELSFRMQQGVNIAVALFAFWLVHKAVKKYYWKRLGKFKTFVIALIITLAIPFAGLTTYWAMINVINYKFNFEHLFLGGSLFVSIYFFFWAFAKPKKWYVKPLTAMTAFAIIIAVQWVLMTLNGPVDIATLKVANAPYLKELSTMIMPAMQYIFLNGGEIILMTVLFTYFATRRRFWLKTKATVSEYNSPVLLKSMKMD
ncbi:hypothetical protein CXF85_22030 [Colwellia sp. 75C3]|uniref:DnaJ-like cysteine-rich domain-containing protein n=1 Tax=Colwellia sp. 75C3 TaxID=888425 RepID=UPI000C331B47|nr:hypothetical protein [Colwellia sp. 75C3]PKG80790.1 hypothetical protein CXF85_22030 [Colwellia sp. 75C3]